MGIMQTKGIRYGRLLALSNPLKYEGIKYYWVECLCDCGIKTTKRLDQLRSGRTKSCGCILRKHGEEGTSLYRRWRNMRERCNNPNTHSWHNYGGRGIRVCLPWNNFRVFRDWSNLSGYSEDLQIDRIDVNGDYCPENCRWVTNKINSSNKRNNVILTIWGETRIMSDWVRDSRCSVSRSTVQRRIKQGMAPEVAITSPPGEAQTSKQAEELTHGSRI